MNRIAKLSLTSFLAMALSLGICLPASHATAAPNTGSLGVGLAAGEPSSITLKWWVDPVNAFDVAIGGAGLYYNYYNNTYTNGPNLHADYLWHFYDAFGSVGTPAGDKMPLYVGVGGVYANPSFTGVRAVVGVTYLFDHPFNVFLEAAPTLGLSPNTGYAGVDAALGGRFYFW